MRIQDHLPKAFKTEARQLWRAFFEHRKGLRYLWNRLVLAKMLLRHPRVLERPINCPRLSVHMLTGRRDLVQTLWALASFYNVSETIGRLYIHSDGTFTDEDKTLLKTCFPSCQLLDPTEAQRSVAQRIGVDYPGIVSFRADHARDLYLKKYIDGRIISDAAYHLIIDSDVLWFKNPHHIYDEIAKDHPKSFMMDGSHARCFVRFKDGTRISERLASFNSGIIFYHVENFRLKKLQELLERFDDTDRGNFFFLDQACHAYCLEDTLEMLPSAEYHIQGMVTERSVARHYTRPRRWLLYQEGLEILKPQLMW